MTQTNKPIAVIRLAQPSDLATIVEFNRRLALETEGKVLDLAILDLGVSSCSGRA